MIDDYGTLAALAAIAFAGAVVYGITGFGSALITIPLATHLVPLTFALAMFSVVDLANSLRVGLENPRHAVKAEVVRMAPMIVVGLAVGVTLLVNLPRKTGMLALGVFIAAYAVYSLTRRASMGTVSRRWAYVAGVGGGLTGALFGAGGPPYAIYLSHRPLTKDEFRATLTFTSVFSIGLRVLAFLVSGLLLDLRAWIAAAIAIPVALAGITVATRIFRRISREALARLVGVMLLATGVSLVARALV
ncbi:MAG TPA: sulfite exporter TauE/SafE family protein [Burkholderiales bacterium]|nr:sulfite exporter TauE/SafE family protein [Burkholderiales bacterium]